MDADEDKELSPGGEELSGLPGSVNTYDNSASNGDVISLSSDDFGDGLAGVELPLEQDKSQQLLTIPCSMVVLAHAVPGTLAFTRNDLTFTANDSTEEYNKASYLVGSN